MASGMASAAKLQVLPAVVPCASTTAPSPSRRRRRRNFHLIVSPSPALSARAGRFSVRCRGRFPGGDDGDKSVDAASSPPQSQKEDHDSFSGWVASVAAKMSAAAASLLTATATAEPGQNQIPPQVMISPAAFRDQSFFLSMHDLFLTHGSIFRLTLGPKSFLIVSDPDIAKHILRDNSKAYSKGILSEILEFVMGKGLIPADGETWRVRRRAIVPALHKKYITAMIDLFGKASHRLCSKLDKAALDGENVDMESFFSQMTLDVIGKAVFNYEFDSLTYDKGIVEAVYVVLKEAEMRSTSPIPTWEIPIWKHISPRQRKVKEALALLNSTLDELIAICRRFVEQEDLQFHDEYINKQDPSILHFLVAAGDDVSSKQLRDDLMTLLIAGHETSAAVLTWTFFLLCKYPEIMTKLQDEVDSVLGDRLPTIEDVKKLKYTTRVINESLRLYPQPPILVRRSLEGDILGEYPIGPGEDIFISVWNLHRSPKLWDDADVFKPERWPLDGPNPNEINQNFSYLPFGGGPRKCIGEVFATFENVVATAMLVRRFDFEMAPGAPPVEMTSGATIHTREGLVMRVTPRRNYKRGVGEAILINSVL